MKPKVFQDKEKLNEMLAYYSYWKCVAQTARRFKCDRSSILYQISKAGLSKSKYGFKNSDKYIKHATS